MSDCRTARHDPTQETALKLKRMLVAILTFAPWTSTVSTVRCQDISLDTLPAVVVESSPRAGETEVDPKLREIRVTFSKAMHDGGWSAVQLSRDTFPKIVGQPKYLDDGRTWVIQVRLKPGQVYAIRLNTKRFQNFKDTNKQPAVPYLLAFRTKGKGDRPAGNKTGMNAPSPRVLREAFDALWDDMRRHYSYFDLKGIDGAALTARYRKQASTSKTENDFVGVLKTMLAELHDGHVWIEHHGRELSTYQEQQRPRNINLDATIATLENVQHRGRFAVVGTTKRDGFAALVIVRQSNADVATVEQVIRFVRSMHDAPGFLVDLRLANGGNELLAQRIASQFCGTETVYALSTVRDGPRATDFSRARKRVLPAVARAYDQPVVCLLGPGCVSSGEGFALMMKCLPHVTTIGEATRGSSGNPAAFKLPGVDVTVWYSRWVAMLPDESPIEDVGIVPEVEVTFSREAYRDEDLTWRKAVAILRDRTGN